MKTKIIPLLLLSISVNIAFIQAEEPDNSSVINRINVYVGESDGLALTSTGAATASNPNAITEERAVSLINQFIIDTFNRHVRARNLNISEISLTVDWGLSTHENIFLNIGAKFTNFPINTRILNGRLETQLVMRPPEKRRILPDRDWRIDNEDNKDIIIKLLVDDQLTNERRRAMTTEYIRMNYNNPIDIQIYDERTEIYGDRVYSYVSSVVNNDSIVYLRVVFEKQAPQTERSAIFLIEGSQWLTNRAEVIFNKKFPAIDDNSIKGLNSDMFKFMSSYYTKTIGGNKNYKQGSSKIRFIGPIALISAGNGLVKLELDTTYRLDFSGWFGTYKDYNVKVNAYFQFDFEKGIWVYKNIDNIGESNIRAL